MKGDPLRGVHAFYRRVAREWWAPLRPIAGCSGATRSWRCSTSRASSPGRAVHEWSAQVFRDDEGTVLSGQYRLMIRTEREKAREKKKYDAIEPRRTPTTQIAEIEAQYAASARRGAEPRWWEDVDEGDDGGSDGEGPADGHRHGVLARRHGHGPLRRQAAARSASPNRRRIPRFFHRDDQDVPDVMQRVHWDPEFARDAGNPTTYDYGRMRETWLIHLCTDWMGDDAWLWKLECEFRGFNYVGDMHWLTGTVTRKYLADGDRPAVDLELAATNQRGDRHHARARDHPAAEPRARAGPAPRSARRRDRPRRRARRDLSAEFARR